MNSDKIIITCAITGSIHTPSMTPYLPITARQIIDESLAASAAGAAILHLHARDPDNGAPSAAAAHFMAFLAPIKQQCSAVLNITTGGSAVMSLGQRLEGALLAEPEMCSVNMGSMNFALYPAAAKIQHWQQDWEQAFLQNSDDLVFKNTPRDIAHVMQEMGKSVARASSLSAMTLASVHAASFSGPRAGQATAVHPVCIRGARWYGC
ncbi:MAG: 3-keto-5-aminohexanoate cleavage protein [Thiolinea sp.]